MGTWIVALCVAGVAGLAVRSLWKDHMAAAAETAAAAGAADTDPGGPGIIKSRSAPLWPAGGALTYKNEQIDLLF